MWWPFPLEYEFLPFTDPVVVFAVVMVIILIAPMTMRRMRVPGLIGVILAGAIVGPSMLHLLERDRTIELLGTVGLLYLMFSAGLSMDLNQFMRMRGRSVGFGVISFLIPQVLGILVGITLLGFDPVPAVLLGSIVGSHTLLAYPIAKRLGITKNRAVTMSMGGTIVTDALALTVLAVVVAMTVGEIGLLFWVKFVGLVACYAVAMVFGLPIVGRWFFRNVQERGDADFVFLLVVLFVSAVLAEQVRLAPIVGAFLAGLTMNRLVPDTGPLMNRVHFVGGALFIPFFLLSVGMLVDFNVLFSTFEVWWLAIAFTGLVLVGKISAAKITQWMYGLTREEGWTVIGLTTPQAAATLAVTLVGYDLGLFDLAAVNAVVLLMLLTCFVGPSLVERFGRPVALKEEQTSFDPGDAPQRVMVPLANPATADELMDVAFLVRGPESQEPIYPLTVARDGPDVAAQVAAGEKLLSHAVIHAAGAGVPVLPLTRVDMNVADGIERAIKERRITVLVIGWNGVVTTRQRVLGSILDQILHESAQMVLICRLTEVPLNTTPRVVMLMPRYAEREPGFLESVRTMKRLTKGLGADLLVLTPQNRVDVMEKAIEPVKPAVDQRVEPISSWSDLMPDLSTRLKDDDLLVLFSTRYERVSWSSELDRLPRRLAARFPRMNFITTYPPEGVPDAPAGTAPSPAAAIISTDRIAVDLADMDFGEALHHLLTPHFTSAPRDLELVHSAVMKNLEHNALRLAPGVVLIQQHVRQINAPLVFIGRSGGLAVPGIDKPVELVLVVLSPTELSPDEHLRVLSNVARMMSGEQIVDQLRQAASAEEIAAILRGEPERKPT